MSAKCPHTSDYSVYTLLKFLCDSIQEGHKKYILSLSAILFAIGSLIVVLTDIG